MSGKQRVYTQNPMATSRRRRDFNNNKSNSNINKSNTTRTIQSKSRQPLSDMENINPQQKHQKKQQQKRLSKQIANSQRDKSYLYNVDNKKSSFKVVVEKELSKKQQRTASKSQSHKAASSRHRTTKSKVLKPTRVPVNNNNNNTAISNQSMPQVISFEEFKSIRRSGGSLPSSQSSTVMWSPTREQQSRGDENGGGRQLKGGKQQKGREGNNQHMKEMMMEPMSFEQFKIMRRTGQLPLVPPVLPPPNNSMSDGNEQHGKGGPQIMSFEEFKEMKRLLRSNNLEDSAAHTISKKSSRATNKMNKQSKKKSLKKSSRAKDVNSTMKKDSLGSKKMDSSKSSNKLQTIPNTKQQQQQKKNKVSNRLLSRKTKKKATTKQKSLSINKEVNVQVQEEEKKKILSPIPEVITELTPTASSGIESVVDKEGSVKGDDDNVKTAVVVEDQSIQQVTSTTLNIYSAMLNEAEPYLSMKKEEVPTEEKQVERVDDKKEERLPVVDSVDSTDDNNEREGVADEVVGDYKESYNEVAPDISMVVCADEEKIVGENRIGFDSSSSNLQKVDDDVVGKDVTIPSLTETSKPLVRALDFDDEVDVMEDQPVKMSDEIPPKSDNNKPDKKGRILHIRTKRKINKGNIKKTMIKILPSFGRSISKKAEQLAAATKQEQLITDVKVFVPSPEADGMPVSPSAMSIISVESSVVVSNCGTIIDTEPVTSDSLPQDLLYGVINYDFKNFDEHSDSHLDVSQPPTSIPILNVESPDEEEDPESIRVEVIEQARVSDNDNVATEEVVAVVAPEEDTKEKTKIEVGHNSEVATDDETMKLTHPQSTFQKKAETEEFNENILTESNDISYLDEYQQALLASYVHDMDAEEEVDSDAEEDVEDNLQAPDTTHSDQTSIAESVIDSNSDSSLPGPIIHEKDITEKEEPAIYIGDVNDEDEPEDELVVTTKLQKSIKLSVVTAFSTSSSVVPKKSFESGIQKRKIPSPASTTSSFPKSESKKCSNGLVKSRISDIQQRIDALSSSASSFDNRGTGRYSYSHPLPSPTCSVSSAASSISSKMSSSSYIRTVPIGIAKTYSQNLESPSGSVVGLGFGNSALDIDSNQWQEERVTTVSYAQKYIK